MALVAKVRNYRVYSTNNKGQFSFTVKRKFFSMVDCGWHEETIAKYDDLRSCLLYIADLDIG